MKSLLSISILMLMCCCSCVHSEESTFQERLYKLCAEMRSLDDAEVGFEKALTLITKESSFEDCGKVYAAICFTFSNSGLKDSNAEKIIRYGECALSFPLTPDTTRRIQLCIIGAKWRNLEKLHGAALIVAQKEILMLCLRGLAGPERQVSDFESVEVHGVDKYDIGNDTGPVGKAIVDEHDKQLAARKLADLHNDLADRLNGFIRVLMMVERTSINNDDLRSAASKVGCNEEVIKYLIDKLEKKPEQPQK